MDQRNRNQGDIVAVGQVGDYSVEVIFTPRDGHDAFAWRAIQGDKIVRTSDTVYLSISEAIGNAIASLDEQGESIVLGEADDESFDNLNALIVANVLGRRIATMEDVAITYEFLRQNALESIEDQKVVVQDMTKIVQVVSAFKGPFNQLTIRAQELLELLERHHEALMSVATRDAMILESFMRFHSDSDK